MSSRSGLPPAQRAAASQAIDRLDTAFLRLRRALVRPATAALPLPTVGHTVDLAKILACQAVAETTAPQCPATVKDVATWLELEHSTASRLLGDAEADGLVERGVDPVDRRRTTVRLTDTGAGVVTDTRAMRHWFLAQVLAEWDSGDIAQLADLLSRAVDTFVARAAVVRDLAEDRFNPSEA